MTENPVGHTPLTDPLVALLDKRHPDGKPFFSYDDVKDFVVMVLLATGQVSEAEEIPELAGLLHERALRMGINGNMSDPEALIAFNRYFAKTPPNGILVKEFEWLMRGPGSRPMIDLKAKNIGRAFALFQGVLNETQTPVRQCKLWDESDE